MIIGLSGYAQSGKDTIAMHLVQNHGFERIAFADPLREALFALNPVITDLPEVFSTSLAHAVEHLGWETVKQNSQQVRELLQRMGTEVGRNLFGQNFWVERAMLKVEPDKNYVFTDVRFPNEYDAIKAIGGKMWRVFKSGVQSANNHISELALDWHEFDEKINNNSTIEELNKAIDILLSKV